ncbi:hypothetical protein NA57DRAFT_74336 [Rhizodiscina lignyota]|uniref:Uncharacterized protein n=1 Tax=Rhizodiscina lignyota TaxID=1504668 RepID=A0A9P4M7R1_9PEZI|nr:hypothetical protein NA57DRAFT_74336 [Rhizodiscina lignyota]
MTSNTIHSAAPANDFRLLRLPTELRWMIYEYVLGRSGTWLDLDPFTGLSNRRSILILLHISRALRRDILTSFTVVGHFYYNFAPAKIDESHSPLHHRRPVEHSRCSYPRSPPLVKDGVTLPDACLGSNSGLLQLFLDFSSQHLQIHLMHWLACPLRGPRDMILAFCRMLRREMLQHKQQAVFTIGMDDYYGQGHFFQDFGNEAFGLWKRVEGMFICLPAHRALWPKYLESRKFPLNRTTRHGIEFLRLQTDYGEVDDGEVNNGVVENGEGDNGGDDTGGNDNGGYDTGGNDNGEDDGGEESDEETEEAVWRRDEAGFTSMGVWRTSGGRRVFEPRYAVLDEDVMQPWDEYCHEKGLLYSSARVPWVRLARKPLIKSYTL